MIISESFKKSIDTIKKGHPYIAEVLDVGENFLRGNYHYLVGNSFKEYFKDKPSDLIFLPIFIGSTAIASLSGHYELVFPGVYSIVSTPVSVIGGIINHKTTKAAIKANQRYKEITGKDFLYEWDKRHLNKDELYDPDKFKLGFMLSNYVLLGIINPITGLIMGFGKIYAGISNKKITKKCNEEIRKL